MTATLNITIGCPGCGATLHLDIIAVVGDGAAPGNVRDCPMCRRELVVRARVAAEIDAEGYDA